MSTAMNAAFLMLCHRPPYHLARLAADYPQQHFYLHYDAKADVAELAFLHGLVNVHILPQRINIRWAGFSMVQAMLLLAQTALAAPHNYSFHFLSGDCVMLQTPAQIAGQCTQFAAHTVWLDSQTVPRLRYRTRFDTPHADTDWQRRLHGKILTKFFQAADKLLPSQTVCYAGSQWFSANRVALEQLYHDGMAALAHFRRKLCPDEHFFQILAEHHAGSLNHIRDNRRLIRFGAGANHPDWLDVPQLQQAQQQGFWFARKASADVMETWFQTEIFVRP